MTARAAPSATGTAWSTLLSMPTLRALSRADKLALGAVALAMLVGASLRTFMAQGDLWLDEVWSLQLVGSVSSAAQVFYGISHDNNHFLNSLWLYWLGPQSPPWAYRAPAVALGAFSIALAARIGWRRSRASAVSAACLASIALPLVVYGSEARGYAGLIAASLLAVAAFDTAIGEPDPPSGWRRPVAWRLGAAIGVGTLFHFTMMATLAVLSLAALMHFAQHGSIRRAMDTTLDLFGPSLLCLVPAMAAVLAGIVNRGGFTFGSLAPSAAGTFARGFGDQLRFMVGLPQELPNAVCFAVAGLIVLPSLRLTSADPLGRSRIFAAVVVLPVAMVAAHLPNLEFPRYYLVPGLVMLLAEADLIGALWNRSGTGSKAVALLVLCASLVGQGVADWSAIKLGRGRYGLALAAAADGAGHLAYGSNDRFWIEAVARTAATRRGLVTHYIATADFCAHSPDWFIDVPEDSEAPVREIVAGPIGCQVRFALRDQIETNPLSGMRWAIYKKVG